LAILPKGVAASLLKGILILFERAATSLVKSYGYFTQGCGRLLVKEMIILCERAAASLVKRYDYFTQGCGCPSCKENSDFM
jgi:hypothetical protein